jgi:hypothetical protein
MLVRDRWPAIAASAFQRFSPTGCDCASATAPDFRVLSAFLAVAWPQLFRNHFKSKDFRVVLLKVIPSFRIF